MLKKLLRYMTDYFINLPLILFLDSGDSYQGAVAFKRVYPKEIEKLRVYSLKHPEFRDQFNEVIEVLKIAGKTIEDILKIHKTSRFASPSWISSYKRLISFVKVPTLSTGPVGFSASEFSIMLEELDEELDKYKRSENIVEGLTINENRTYHKAKIILLLNKMKEYIYESTLS